VKRILQKILTPQYAGVVAATQLLTPTEDLLLAVADELQILTAVGTDAGTEGEADIPEARVTI
jgi:hypothetical protein